MYVANNLYLFCLGWASKKLWRLPWLIICKYTLQCPEYVSSITYIKVFQVQEPFRDTGKTLSLKTICHYYYVIEYRLSYTCLRKLLCEYNKKNTKLRSQCTRRWWGGNGTVTGRWRDCDGTVTGRWRVGDGTVAGQWRDGDETVTRRWRDGDGMVTGRERDVKNIVPSVSSRAHPVYCNLYSLIIIVIRPL